MRCHDDIVTWSASRSTRLLTPLTDGHRGASRLARCPLLSMGVHRCMHLRCVDSSFQICGMTGSTHLSSWVDAETKLRFGNAAARQGLSESALLKRLVGQMLASVPEETLAPSSSVDLRDARVTVRLVPEDRTLLRERAVARNMPAATYVSVLVRTHLRQLAPLPDRELAACGLA